MATETERSGAKPGVETLDRVVIRFAGDSGDGMQLTGTQFTATAAIVGNDLATFPDYPAEIRAPAGTLPGVSGFQINFASEDIFTPGDAPDVLVAMNPAALKVNLKDLKTGGILIVNADAFRETDLNKAGYAANPLEDGSLDGYRLVRVEMTRLTRGALDGNRAPAADGGPLQELLRPRDDVLPVQPAARGLPEVDRGEVRLGAPDRRPRTGSPSRRGTRTARRPRSSRTPTRFPRRELAPGTYRNVSGNQALALGFVAASRKSGPPLFQGSYPITPASDILHELAVHKNFGVITFQAEDEIAAIGAALGASFAGALGITTTSGPGMALKSEFLGLAVMVELPLVVVNIQRGGPSTGLPTKTEQSDLLQALYGRHGEAPCVVIAARSPADCFECAYEASRLAVRHMTPVLLLSDGFIANGAEPWRIPAVDGLAPIPVTFRTDPEGFLPYSRDEATLARPWAIPGTPRLEHRVGGLEKSDGAGNVSYDPLNHERMVHLRAEKIARVALDVPPARAGRESPGGTARDRLGLHLRLDHRGGAARARGGDPRDPAPPQIPQPPAFESRRGAFPLRPDPRSRDEPRTARVRAPGDLPARDPVAVQGRGAAVPRIRDPRPHPRARLGGTAWALPRHSRRRTSPPTRK